MACTHMTSNGLYKKINDNKMIIPLENPKMNPPRFLERERLQEHHQKSITNTTNLHFYLTCFTYTLQGRKTIQELTSSRMEVAKLDLIPDFRVRAT